MKIRLVSKKHVQNAYEKKKTKNQMDIKEESIEEKIEKIPKELFEILGETLSFIDYVNTIEGDKNENK